VHAAKPNSADLTGKYVAGLLRPQSNGALVLSVTCASSAAVVAVGPPFSSASWPENQVLKSTVDSGGLSAGVLTPREIEAEVTAGESLLLFFLCSMLLFVSSQFMLENPEKVRVSVVVSSCCLDGHWCSPGFFL